MMAHFVTSTLIIIRMLDDFITLKCEENFDDNENIYKERYVHLITIIQSSLTSSRRTLLSIRKKKIFLHH